MDLTKYNNIFRGNAPTPQTPQTPVMGQQPTQQSEPWYTKILPALGGIAGGLIGGAAGTAIEPGGGTIAGSMGGSGIGQSLGEMAREWLTGQKLSPGSIIKQGAEGTLYGAIPGGEEGGLIARTATRAGIGAGVGAGTSLIEDIGSKKSVGQAATSAAKSAVAGGITFPIIGGGLDALGGAVKFLGETIPQNIKDIAITKPAELLSTLYNRVSQTLVGHDNVDYAIQKGIIPQSGGMTSQVINESLDRAKTAAQDVEKKLQDEFKAVGDTGAMAVNDVVKFVKQSTAKITNSAKAQKVQDALMNLVSTKTGPDNMVSLATINDMKRVVGQYFKDQSVRDVYHDFKSLIENSTGVPDTIKALNQEAGKLINIKGNLTAWKELPKELPQVFTPKGIQTAVKDAASGRTAGIEAINRITGMIGLFGGLGTLAATKSLTGAGIAGMGLTFGLRSTISSLVDLYFSSPESRIQVAQKFEQIGQSLTSTAEKTKLGYITQALGLRIPSLLKGNTNTQ